MIAWLFAFIVTCAVELAVVYWLGPQHPRRLRVAALAQLGTHPFVWIAMAALPGSQLARLACVELWATLVEAAVYKRFLGLRGRDAFALSALANAASLLVVSAAALLV
ncbi:MAG TPA: hypothetical protein VIV40_37960 [Kofleriaceae bacterium]